jgi:hypothetical protein
MDLMERIKIWTPVFGAVVAAALLPALLQPACGASSAASLSPINGAGERDGSHDFDFNHGVWHTHIHRTLDPFNPASESIDLDGTVNTRKVWGGRAALEEIETEGPQGHWEGMTLFLYNPQAHQWSMSFLNGKEPNLGLPLVGSFHDGVGELFSQDTFRNRSILVRGKWSAIAADSHQYEESYSQDGGASWHQAFLAKLTRTQNALAAPGEAPHDFDFDLGQWQTHSKRLLHPLSGSNTWVELDGETDVAPAWGGRANLAQYHADGPAGRIELLSLRWYNPVAHQWNLDFATPGVGVLGVPGAGVFRDGRADFFDQEIIDGKSILVRFSIWAIDANSAQSEQAFSPDGGKTWEVNWVNKYTRKTSPSAKN